MESLLKCIKNYIPTWGMILGLLVKSLVLFGLSTKDMRHQSITPQFSCTELSHMLI